MNELSRGCVTLTLLLLGACSAPRDTDSIDRAAGGAPRGGSGIHSGGAGTSLPGPGGSGAKTTGGTPSGGAQASAGGNAGGAPHTGGALNGGGFAGEPSLPPAEACAFSHSKLIDVATAQALGSALSSAAPGTMIRLADAEFVGAFSSDKSGDAQSPIVLCGSRHATLRSNGSSTVFGLKGDYWILSGFSITGGQKGVLLDGANNNLFTGLSIHGIGNEGVHFRAHSSDNTFEWSELFDTGNASSEFGEGVYIGSAASQWAKFTGSANTPDRSDRNVVRNNKLGPNIRAEHIDVKEGSSGGLIQNNAFDGVGMVSDGFADSWVDVKGNDYALLDNQGAGSPADGFQVHVVKDGWGNNNVFRRNEAKVNASGYGFNVSSDASGTVVGCENVVTGAGKGLSNVACQN